MKNKTTESLARFEVYTDKGMGWRWRLTATNGNIVADSGEAYSTRSHCLRAVFHFRALVESASFLPVHPVKGRKR